MGSAGMYELYWSRASGTRWKKLAGYPEFERAYDHMILLKRRCAENSRVSFRIFSNDKDAKKIVFELK